MGAHGAPVVQVFGLHLDLSVAISSTVTAILVLWLVLRGARKAQAGVPHGLGNVLEWYYEFIEGIARDTFSPERAKIFSPFLATLFLYTFVANQVGLVFNLVVGDKSYWKSPTADPHVTLTMALIVLVAAHVMSIRLNGFKGYLKGLLQPSPIGPPLVLMETFTNTLTHGLRLFGNIFAGEVLVGLLVGTLKYSVLVAILLSPALLIWQGFSLFIGTIQAFIFTVLAAVYIAQRVEVH
ncbi:MAG: F0F1 ATP synthase subunit A [Brockia lithotrophica]|nr:F0F1 ATP synthase subunit A [Brockia lithotrophica]MBT9253799.1 F0F1 ATP synthase subunit A [Brockia lithotrophica]